MLSLALALFFGSAQAAPVIPQVSINVSGSHELSDRVDLRGQAIGFFVPGAEGTELFFTYAGASVAVTDHWKVTVQPGMVANWMGESDISPALAVINTFPVAGFDFFLDTELYLTEGGPAYYGYYSVTHAAGPFVVGAQAEQVNDGVAFGPQIGTPLGEVLFYSVEYYYNPVTGDQALRNGLIVGF